MAGEWKREGSTFEVNQKFDLRNYLEQTLPWSTRITFDVRMFTATAYTNVNTVWHCLRVSQSEPAVNCNFALKLDKRRQ